MSHVFIDQRIPLTRKWGMTASVGLSCFYGEDVFDESQSCFDKENLYPSLAMGATFLLKPREKLVIRAEVAIGEAGRRALYLRPGQPF